MTTRAMKARFIGLSVSSACFIFVAGCNPQPSPPSAPSPTPTASSPVASSAARTPDEIALIEASIKGDTAAVQDLLNKGVNPNTKDSEGRTPLSEACFYGHIDIVKALVVKGGNVWAKKSDGETPFTMAAGHPEVMQFLKQNQELIEAAHNGDNKTVQALLDKGAYVNAKDGDGRTALTEAAWENHIDTVKLLLNKGADPNARKNDGTTPMSIARGRGYKEIEEMLKKAGEK
jgi:cytohesin